MRNPAPTPPVRIGTLKPEPQEAALRIITSKQTNNSAFETCSRFVPALALFSSFISITRLLSSLSSFIVFLSALVENVRKEGGMEMEGEKKIPVLSQYELAFKDKTSCGWLGFS